MSIVAGELYQPVWHQVVQPPYCHLSSGALREAAKAAVTEVDTATVTVHAPVPVHPPPLQPVNVDPAAGAAVSVTDDPPG